MKTTTLKGRDEPLPIVYSKQILFAVINGEKTVIQENQSCKDYCSDVLYYCFSNKAEPYIDNKSFVQPDKPRFLITLPRKYQNKYDETVENILNFVHQVENELKFNDKTVIYKVKWGKSKITSDFEFCVIGASGWIFSLPMFSLFQTIIRSVSGIHKKGDKWRDTLKKINKDENTFTDYLYDKSYIAEGHYLLELYIKYGYKKFFYPTFEENWNKSEHGGSSHSSGISGLYKTIFYSDEHSNYKSYVLHLHYVRSELLKEIEQLEGKKLFPNYVKGEDDLDEEGEKELGVISLYK